MRGVSACSQLKSGYCALLRPVALYGPISFETLRGGPSFRASGAGLQPECMKSTDWEDSGWVFSLKKTNIGLTRVKHNS